MIHSHNPSFVTLHHNKKNPVRTGLALTCKYHQYLSIWDWASARAWDGTSIKNASSCAWAAAARPEGLHREAATAEPGLPPKWGEARAACEVRGNAAAAEPSRALTHSCGERLGLHVSCGVLRPLQNHPGHPPMWGEAPSGCM